MPEAKAGRPKPPPRERLLRGLVALLMTPFLLLTVLLIGCWLQASGKLPVHRRMVLGVGDIGPTRRRRTIARWRSGRGSGLNTRNAFG